VLKERAKLAFREQKKGSHLHRVGSLDKKKTNEKRWAAIRRCCRPEQEGKASQEKNGKGSGPRKGGVEGTPLRCFSLKDGKTKGGEREIPGPDLPHREKQIHRNKVSPDSSYRARARDRIKENEAGRRPHGGRESSVKTRAQGRGG